MIVAFLASTVLAQIASETGTPDAFAPGRESTGQRAAQCNLTGQEVMGNVRICRYDCGTTETIDERAVCAFVQYR